MTCLSEQNPAFLVKDYAELNPTGIVLIDYPNNIKRITNYRDFEERISSIIGQMPKDGIKSEDCVAVISKGRAEVAEIFFAAMRLGAIPLTINPEQSLKFIEEIILDTNSRFIYFESCCNRSIKNSTKLKQHCSLVSIGWESDDVKTYDDCLQQGCLQKNSNIYGNVPSYITYTSGSTGKPKGVLRKFTPKRWLNLYPPFLGIKFTIPEKTERNTKYIVSQPIFHSIPDVIHAVCAGSKTILMSTFEPNQFFKLISENELQCCDILPSLLSVIAQKKSLIKNLNLSRLKLICVFGAPVSNNLISECEDLFNCKVVPLFAMSEGNPILDFNQVKEHDIPAGSLGRESKVSSIKLVNSSGNGSDFGEMWFNNPTLFESYYKQPELTRSKFNNGWFMTGDLFSRDSDGFYYYHGRKDDMFICDGENVYPIEIESILCGHNVVMQACVVPLASSDHGDVPVAMITCKPGETISEEKLKEHYLNHGAEFLCPRIISVVKEIPILRSGKIDRKTIIRTFSEEAENQKL